MNEINNLKWSNIRSKKVGVVMMRGWKRVSGMVG